MWDPWSTLLAIAQRGLDRLASYWQEAVNVDTFPQIAAGGTAGLILFLLLALYFFASGRVRWTDPKETEATKKLADSMELMLDQIKENFTLLQKVVPTLEKQNELIGTLVREREVDREVERRLKAVRPAGSRGSSSV